MAERKTDYHPMKFRPPFRDDPNDPYDFFKEQRTRAKKALLAKWGAALGTIGGLALTIAISYDYFSFDETAAQRDSKWGSPWGNKLIVKSLSTDNAGGPVELRLLLNDIPTDVIGYAKPGCLVEGIQTYGPDYPVDPQDEEDLPLVVETDPKTGEAKRYRPWFQVEVPAYAWNEQGQFRPKLDENGNQVVLTGIISGADLVAPQYGRPCR